MITPENLDRYRKLIPDYAQPMRLPSIIQKRLNFPTDRIIILMTIFDAVRRVLFYGGIIGLIFHDVFFGVLVPSVFLVVSIVMWLIFRRWAAFAAASPEEIARNTEIYERIFEKVQSNAMAEAFFCTAFEIADPDIYSNDVDTVMHNALEEICSLERLGQRDCSQGHSALCVHKIPPHLAQWVASA